MQSILDASGFPFEVVVNHLVVANDDQGDCSSRDGSSMVSCFSGRISGVFRRVRQAEEVTCNGADVVVDDDGFVDVVVKWVFGFRHFVVSKTVDVSFQPVGFS